MDVYFLIRKLIAIFGDVIKTNLLVVGVKVVKNKNKKSSTIYSSDVA
jgi:hypothetical protein